MPITQATESPKFHLPGFHFTGHTAPSRGATENATWRLEVDPGAISQSHQIDREEIFILLAGSLTFTITGQENILTTGDALSIPPHSLFSIANNGTETALAIVCLPVGVNATDAQGNPLTTAPWAR